MSDIAEELRSLADTASRHGHYDRLNAAAEAVDRLTRELAQARRTIAVLAAHVAASVINHPTTGKPKTHLDAEEPKP